MGMTNRKKFWLDMREGKYLGTLNCRLTVLQRRTTPVAIEIRETP